MCVQVDETMLEAGGCPGAASLMSNRERKRQRSKTLRVWQFTGKQPTSEEAAH